MSDNVAVPVAGGARETPPLPSQVRQWGSLSDLSSLRWWENALAARPFERMPWLAVAMLGGIVAWFVLPSPAEWLVFSGCCGAIAGLAMLLIDARDHPYLRSGVMAFCLMAAIGLATIWTRSELAGTSAIGRPIVGEMAVRVLEREEDAANERVRLLIATADATGEPIRARISVPERFDDSDLAPGSTAIMRLRLIPPSRATFPGAYDFARIAWFDGIAATGSVMSEPQILTRGGDGDRSGLRRRIAGHVRGQVAQAGGEASAMAIAATLTTGDRGGMADGDAQAMRDAGLAHLLSISGLHVGAVIAIAWFVVMRLFALWPWLTLRVPLPLVASGAGALAGIGYTLLSGAALPTIRACLAALLVLAALGLGRQALSMRLVAIAAIAVMLFWPESMIGPSFQLSFAAVVAIVALHNAAPLAKLRREGRGEGVARRLGRYIAMLFLTGLVVELALLPLVLSHFHRAGLYGAGANLVAIPLATIVIMPLLGLSLLADLFGIGAPVWWCAAHAIEWLLAIARETASLPGAIRFSPLVPGWIMAMIAAGGLWLALWSGRVRLLGALPLAVGMLLLLILDPPDLLVSGDGRHVGLTVRNGQTYFLRTGESFDRMVLAELSGMASGVDGDAVRPIEQAPSARCSETFCAIEAGPNGAPLHILIGRGRVQADYASLIDACARSDIVIAENALPESCRPGWLLLDGRALSRRGGAALDLSARSARYVRPARDRHGW